MGMEKLIIDLPDFGILVSTYCTMRDLIVADQDVSVVNLLRSVSVVSGWVSGSLAEIINRIFAKPRLMQ